MKGRAVPSKADCKIARRASVHAFMASRWQKDMNNETERHQAFLCGLVKCQTIGGHILIEIETSRELLIIDRIVHKTGVFSAELVGERSSKVDEVAENLVGKQVKVQLCSESAVVQW